MHKLIYYMKLELLTCNVYDIWSTSALPFGELLTNSADLKRGLIKALTQVHNSKLTSFFAKDALNKSFVSFNVCI